MFTYDKAFEIVENMIHTAYGMAHEQAKTRSGDESPNQRWKRDELTEQLAKLITEQVNQNLYHPFSGRFTTYNSLAEVPDSVRTQLEEELRPFVQIIVCDHTNAYILSHQKDDNKLVFYTLCANEDVIGTFDECVTFLQKNL